MSGTVVGTTRRWAERIGLARGTPILWARGVAGAEVVEPLATRKVVVKVHGRAGVRGWPEVGACGVDASACTAVNSEFLQCRVEGSNMMLS